MGKISRIIYVGPSLYGVTVKRFKNELWQPPAQCGDILRDITRTKPRQVVLLDGVFHQHLAVWHKEIAYALCEGIVCIGAASMGALRAAEMHRYGMIGVGKIFEMYRDGEEDDSLVAMTFDPGTFRPLSESKVGSSLKTRDALEAIAVARSYKGTIKTTLKRSAIAPYLRVAFSHIFNDITS